MFVDTKRARAAKTHALQAENLGTSQHSYLSADTAGLTTPPIIVVGNGPVGVHFINQLVARGYDQPVLVFGEEDCEPYNRVLLSAFLHGEVGFEDIENPIQANPQNVTQLCRRIERIDPLAKVVYDDRGDKYAFSNLILATGSSPHVPSIEGSEMKGVYTFRHLKDTCALQARRVKTRHTVVIGGGLLGLEAAYAMRRYATKVTVIQHTQRLMSRQLDEEGSLRLQTFAESKGLHFLMDAAVSKIEGETTVERIVMRDGTELECDTVIFATGISPNNELAFQSGLAIRKGIKVNEKLNTSEPDIYAIGECADFNNQVFGLVGPGLEQASILASNLTGENNAYKGTVLASSLKVLGLDVASIGDVNDEGKQSVIYAQNNTYRRLFVKRGKVVGAIGIGDWPERKHIEALVESEGYLLPWQSWRFKRTGNVSGKQRSPLDGLSPQTVICNCQQVTLAQINTEIVAGADSLELLGDKLNVARTCGSCKPLVQCALAKPADKLPIAKWLFAFACVAALLVGVLTLLPAISAPTSVQDEGVTWLWTDGLIRQISGFTILGLLTLSLTLSASKRTNMKLKSFSFWRNQHVLLSAMALVLLVMHTGLSFGSGINFYLIINLMILAALGVVSAWIAAFEGRMLSINYKRLKRTLVWGHILAFWPLPILLLFHVLSVYYF